MQKVETQAKTLAIQQFEEHFKVDGSLYSALETLSGCRLVCHCTSRQDRHAHVLTKEFISSFTTALDRGCIDGGPPLPSVLNFLASLGEELDSDGGSTADEGAFFSTSGRLVRQRSALGSQNWICDWHSLASPVKEELAEASATNISKTTIPPLVPQFKSRHSRSHAKVLNERRLLLCTFTLQQPHTRSSHGRHSRRGATDHACVSLAAAVKFFLTRHRDQSILSTGRPHAMSLVSLVMGSGCQQLSSQQNCQNLQTSSSRGRSSHASWTREKSFLELEEPIFYDQRPEQTGLPWGVVNMSAAVWQHLSTAKGRRK